MRRFIKVMVGICIITSLVLNISYACECELTIGNYELHSSTRVGRVEYEYTYRADINNRGRSANNVIATLASGSPNTVVIEGRLDIGDITAGATVLSSDTFTIRQNRQYPLNLDDLTWTISCDDQNPEDNCPNDPDKTEPGVCGCGVADTDTDGDGTLDCVDQCPSDPNKTEPGVCGCGVADTDADGDGTLECIDQCPSDPNKTAPGICGCGMADTDADGDGTLDCVDQCPSDPNKTEPGVCGCGVTDAETDSDGDGVIGCLDGCPDDPEKTAPGICGCNVDDSIDTDGDSISDCVDQCPNTPYGLSVGNDGCPHSKTGSSTGDPHFFTFDGLVYHDQSIGEFVLSRQDGEDNFEIQARQGRLSGLSPCVTLNTATAMRLNDNVIEYRAGTDEILIDGVVISLAESEEFTTANGVVVRRSRGIICNDAQSNISVRAVDRGSYINIYVTINGLLQNMFSGLFGNFDGHTGNDMSLRDGSTAQNLIEFINDWRLSNSESLFTYAPGQDTFTFTALQTCSLRLTPADIDYARQLYNSIFGESACDEAMVISIATDLAVGMSEEEVVEWVTNIRGYLVPTGTMWFRDVDNDGFGNADDSVVSCLQPEGFVDNHSDCNDDDESINPDAHEIIGNDIDENCDGTVIFSSEIINLNGRSSSRTNVALNSGQYNIIPIGPADGGIYTAWSAWNYGNQWLNRYRIASDELGDISVNDSTRYSTPALALSNSQSITLDLNYDQIVSFYIPDDPYTDNRGGLSFRIERVE